MSQLSPPTHPPLSAPTPTESAAPVARDERALSPAVLATLIAIVAVAAALRFFNLTREGLWYDELIMANLVSGPWSEVWQETLYARPPLYVMISWLLTHILGTSEFAFRSLSAVLGISSVAMIFVVGRQMFSNTVGLIAAIFMALSPYQIYYSQEHRYYALVVFISLICLWLLMRALRSGRSRDFVYFGVAGALLHFSHYLNVFVFGAMAVGVVLSWRRWPSRVPWSFFAIVPMTVMVAAAPMFNQLYYAVMRTAAPEVADAAEVIETPQVMWIQSPPLWSPIRTLANFLLLGLKHIEMVCVGLSAVLLVSGLIWTLRQARYRPVPAVISRLRGLLKHHRQHLILLICILLLPMAAGLVVSAIVEPMYDDRYFIAASVPLYLLIGVGTVILRPMLSMKIATAAIVILMLGSTYNYYTQPIRGQWREAGAFLNEQMSPQDTLLFTSERGDTYEGELVGKSIAWYLTDPPKSDWVNVIQPPAEFVDEITAKGSATGRTWLLIWDDPGRDRELDTSLQNAPPSKLTLIRSLQFDELDIHEVQVGNVN
jgi:4-amino-4-deoxy-L-arabinose transferase-like glycosyltransferase